jgi:hypothetical protein
MYVAVLYNVWFVVCFSCDCGRMVLSGDEGEARDAALC